MKRAWPLLALLAACATPARETRLPPEPAAVPVEEEVLLGGKRWHLPARLKEELARERTDLGGFPLTLSDVEGAPTVRVRSVLEPEVQESPRPGVAFFKAYLDENVTSECVVRSDRLEIAQTFHQVFAEIERRPALHMRQMGEVHSQEADGWPLVSLRMEYLTPSREYGAVRMAATNVHDLGVFCSMDAPGYEKTFLAMMSDLVGSLRVAVPDKALSRSFDWVSMDGGWRGLVENVRRVRGDGVHVELQFASLMRTQARGLAVLDEINLEVTRSDGDLVMMRVLRQRDGRMQRDLTLAPSPSRHATLRGREMAEGEEDLGSTLPATARELREHYVHALREGGGPRTFVRYYPGVEAGSLAEETVELVGHTEGVGHFRSVIRTPTDRVEGDYQVGADGELLRSIVRWKDATLTIERLASFKQ